MLRKQQMKAQDAAKQAKKELKERLSVESRSMQQFDELEKMLVSREAELKSSRKQNGKLKEKKRELVNILTDVLNVKLRYEQIIKRVIENDKKEEEKRLSVLAVIDNSKVEF